MRVPLVVAGPGVACPGVVERPVDVSYLFASIVGASLNGGLLTGVAVAGVSLLPSLEDRDAPAHRPDVVTQLLAGQNPADRLGSASRNARFKFIRTLAGVESLYDLDADPREVAELLKISPLATDAQAAFEALGATLDGAGLAP
ncbi:MAG: hypothetical protein R3F39_25450 [Myxococcota bacterium]